MLEAGGLARFLAGDARWDRWRDAYAADFVVRDVSASTLSFDETGYLGEEEQLRLLRGAPGGGESNVPDLVEVSSRTGPFRRCAWKLRAARRCPPLPLLTRLACLEQAPLHPSRVCLALQLRSLLCALMVRA